MSRSTMSRTDAAALARAAKAAKAPSLADRFWSKVDRKGEDECWNWSAAVRRKDEGYGAFWMNGRHRPSNQVAYELSAGPVPCGMVVCHSCDNPRCCNPAHLFIGTNLDNNDDKVAKHRHAHGSTMGTAKLTEADVVEIRAAKIHGKRAPHGLAIALAERFGVKAQTISEIWGRKSWKHI